MYAVFSTLFISGFGGGSNFGGSGGGINSLEPWQSASPANMAQIRDLQVQCEKDLMRVRIEFDRPFYGMIFSKGHYSNVNCVHVPSGLGQTQVRQKPDFYAFNCRTSTIVYSSLVLL